MPTDAEPLTQAKNLLRQAFSELKSPQEDWSSAEASLLAFSFLLSAWSQHMNLTGHKDLLTVTKHLILEALAIETILPAGSSLVDLGAGAGIPGIPLGILRPRLAVTLLEARERRHYFQKEAIRQLKLPNVRAVRSRIEDLTSSSYDLVIAQALAKPEQALKWMLPLVQAGGWLAIPLGSSSAEPLAVANVEARVVEYRVPIVKLARKLWLGKKERV